MRRAARIDANQPDIVAAFRALGCSVQPLHAVGQGCPDLLVACAFQNLLVEVKDGAKPPSRRALTPEQVRFHDEWHAPVHIVESEADVVALVNRIRG